MVKVKDKKPTELTIYDDNTGDVLAVYPSEMVETLQNTVAKNSTKSELIMFLSIANKYGLDPFLKEIWFIKYSFFKKGMLQQKQYGKLLYSTGSTAGCSLAT